MTIQSNDFYFSENSSFLFEENNDARQVVSDNYYIPNKHTFIFDDQRNQKIEKKVIKQLGEKRNLWTR